MESEKGFIVLALSLGVVTLVSYLLLPAFLGYDSYFFLDGVCGEGKLYNEASLFTNPPLSKLLFSVLPCNFFVIKTVLIGFFVGSLLAIYLLSRFYHGKRAWMAIPLTLIFPVFFYNSLKLENDAFAFPFIFFATYFFMRHLHQKANNGKEIKWLALFLISIGIALGFWGGAIYPLIIFSFFEKILLILTIPLIIYFFGNLIGPLTPSLDGKLSENNSFKFFRQTIFFFGLYFMQGRLWSVSKKKWFFVLPFLIIGLLAPKFLVLFTPFIPLILLEAQKNGLPRELGVFKDVRVLFKPLVFLIAFVMVIAIPLGVQGPQEYEHELVKDSIRISEEKGLKLENDWGLGHLVYYHWGETTKHSGYSEITCSDCIVLSYKEFECPVLREENKLKIYEC